MNALRWHLYQWARRLGASGLVGLGLLAVALLLQVTLVESSQQAARAQHYKLAAQRLAAITHDADPVPVSFNPLTMLPPTGEAAQCIGELERLAHAHGISLPRGQYSVSPPSIARRSTATTRSTPLSPACRKA